MRQSLLDTLRMLGMDSVRIQAHRESDLPVCKGMASSTADVLAAAASLADAVGQRLSPPTLARIATGIESSDGVMYPGVAAVNHRTGRLIHSFSWWPRLWVVIAVPHTRLDTSTVSFAGKSARSAEFDTLLATLRRAEGERDAHSIAACATRSAEINQEWVANPLFDTFQGLSVSLGALGVAVAHTGVVLGMLFPDTQDGCAAARKAMNQLPDRCPPGTTFLLTQLEGTRAWPDA